jgi:hypothetical protein
MSHRCERLELKPPSEGIKHSPALAGVLAVRSLTGRIERFAISRKLLQDAEANALIQISCACPEIRIGVESDDVDSAGAQDVQRM